MNTHREKGLALLLKKLKISEANIEFVGRTSGLEKDPIVGKVSWEVTNSKDMEVYLRGMIEEEGVKKLAEKYVPETPKEYSQKGDGIIERRTAQLTYAFGSETLALKFIMPLSDEEWTPDQGYVDK